MLLFLFVHIVVIIVVTDAEDLVDDAVTGAGEIIDDIVPDGNGNNNDNVNK